MAEVILLPEPELLEPLLELMVAAGVWVVLAEEPDELLVVAAGVWVVLAVELLLELPLEEEELLLEPKAGVFTTTPLTIPTCLPL